jgi:hypothetical protein
MTPRQVNNFLLNNKRTEKVYRYTKKLNDISDSLYESMMDGNSTIFIELYCDKLIELSEEIKSKSIQLKLTDEEKEAKIHRGL